MLRHRPRAARATAPALPGPLTADLEDMLADEALAPSWWRPPVPTHAALAELALTAGKHCFVEKPLACDVASAAAPRRARRRAGAGP